MNRAFTDCLNVKGFLTSCFFPLFFASLQGNKNYENVLDFVYVINLKNINISIINHLQMLPVFNIQCLQVKKKLNSVLYMY